MCAYKHWKLRRHLVGGVDAPEGKLHVRHREAPFFGAVEAPHLQVPRPPARVDQTSAPSPPNPPTPRTKTLSLSHQTRTASDSQQNCVLVASSGASNAAWIQPAPPSTNAADRARHMQFRLATIWSNQSTRDSADSAEKTGSLRHSRETRTAACRGGRGRATLTQPPSAPDRSHLSLLRSQRAPSSSARTFPGTCPQRAECLAPEAARALPGRCSR